jgi:hypothetical protein
MTLLCICYTPSLVFGIQESIHAEAYAYGLANHCSATPLWVHQLEAVTQLAMTCFASLCGIVYCASCPSFRQKILFILGRGVSPQFSVNLTDTDLGEHDNGVADDFSSTNEGIAMEILPTSELRLQAENMISSSNYSV